jgi:Spy/CpxP family protein refolding chaperone
MKRSFLPLVLLGVTMILFAAPGRAQEANPPAGASTVTSTTPPATPPAGKEKHHGHLLAQLNLTDAQKAKIKQIKKSGTDKKQRKQEVMALLTPAQQQQLRQLIEQRRAQK